MAYEGQQNGDVRATLALSQAEAREGTTRTLNLPGGHQVVVPVPPGTYNGQEIRLEGQGQPSGYGPWRAICFSDLSSARFRLPNGVYTISSTGCIICKLSTDRFTRSGRSIHLISLSSLPAALLF